MKSKEIHPLWEQASNDIAQIVKENPQSFLQHPIVKNMMFCDNDNIMRHELVELLEDKKTELLLKVWPLISTVENFGAPSLLHGYDPNTIHHVYHLNTHAFYIDEKIITEASHVIEFGGGYGNMARIIKQINPDCQYTLIDIPNILSIQQQYLQNTLSTKLFETVKFTTTEQLPEIQDCDFFIANWSLSECPVSLQKKVFNTNLFNAKHFLTSFHQCGNHIPFMQESSYFKEEISKLGASLIQNNIIPGINFYGLK